MLHPMTPLIDMPRPNELMTHGRLFISIILKTRAKPVSVSANGDYEIERGHRYKRGWRRTLKVDARVNWIDVNTNKRKIENGQFRSSRR